MNFAMFLTHFSPTEYEDWKAYGNILLYSSQKL